MVEKNYMVLKIIVLMLLLLFYLYIYTLLTKKNVEIERCFWQLVCEVSNLHCMDFLRFCKLMYPQTATGIQRWPEKTISCRPETLHANELGYYDLFTIFCQGACEWHPYNVQETPMLVNMEGWYDGGTGLLLQETPVWLAVGRSDIPYRQIYSREVMLK